MEVLSDVSRNAQITSRANLTQVEVADVDRVGTSGAVERESYGRSGIAGEGVEFGAGGRVNGVDSGSRNSSVLLNMRGIVRQGSLAISRSQYRSLRKPWRWPWERKSMNEEFSKEIGKQLAKINLQG